MFSRRIIRKTVKLFNIRTKNIGLLVCELITFALMLQILIFILYILPQKVINIITGFKVFNFMEETCMKVPVHKNSDQNLISKSRRKKVHRKSKNTVLKRESHTSQVHCPNNVKQTTHNTKHNFKKVLVFFYKRIPSIYHFLNSFFLCINALVCKLERCLEDASFFCQKFFFSFRCAIVGNQY